jgi:hypothetical protein
MARPKLIGVGTKAQFRRAVPKSYSYRYEVGSASGPDDAPRVSAVIETRYRGKSASWNLSRSMLSPEKWTLNGTFVAPAPETPLTYPAKEPAPEAPAAGAPATPVAPTTPAPPRPPSAMAASAASNIRRAAPAPPPVAPAAPATPGGTPPPARTTPRADPAQTPGAAAAERVFSFGRKLMTPPKS